jgi:hypothetical protein
MLLYPRLTVLTKQQLIQSLHLLLLALMILVTQAHHPHHNKKKRHKTMELTQVLFQHLLPQEIFLAQSPQYLNLILTDNFMQF